MINKIKNGGVCRLLAFVFVGALASGCAGVPKPKPWNVSIVKNTSDSIRVDLIGITEDEKPAWEAYNLDTYWRDGGDTDLHRKDADPLTQVLKMGQPWVVSANDPKWKQWLDRGDTELLVIADIPGTFDPGPADLRRRFLPLAPVWDAKNNTLEIEVKRTEVQVDTPRNAK